MPAAVRRRKTVTNASYAGGSLKGNRKGARKSYQARRRITTSLSLLAFIGIICLVIEFLEWKPTERTLKVRGTGTKGAISNQIDNLKRVMKEKQGEKFNTPKFDDDAGDEEQQDAGKVGQEMDEKKTKEEAKVEIPVEDETPPDVEDEPEPKDLKMEMEDEATARKIRAGQEEEARKIKLAQEEARKVQAEQEAALKMQAVQEEALKVQAQVERAQQEEAQRIASADEEARRVEQGKQEEARRIEHAQQQEQQRNPGEPPKIPEEEIARVEANADEPFQEQKAEVIPLSKFPTLKYGTAWKKDKTSALVRQAIHAGFRHIDTANQPKHYNEAGVGEGWKAAAADLGLQRSDIWIQTKFCNLAGQDPENMPFDKNVSLEDQVRQSVQRSLENLQTDYLDSLVMHGPEKSWDGILTVWKVFEELVNAGKVKQIGVSNIWDVDFIKFLHQKSSIKPAVVQQRFYKDTNFEVETRKFCTEKNIEFQSFWTLGANKEALESETVRNLAQSKGLSPETLMYAFCLTIGISPLDGTTNDQHMTEDIDLLKRFSSAENKVFTDEKELTVIAEALGMQQWISPKL